MVMLEVGFVAGEAGPRFGTDFLVDRVDILDSEPLIIRKHYE